MGNTDSDRMSVSTEGTTGSEQRIAAGICHWLAAKAPSGHVYYYNIHTKNTTYQMPREYAAKHGINLQKIRTAQASKLKVGNKRPAQTIAAAPVSKKSKPSPMSEVE